MTEEIIINTLLERGYPSSIGYVARTLGLSYDVTKGKMNRMVKDRKIKTENSKGFTKYLNL